mgnify:CR=1 FL=1
MPPTIPVKSAIIGLIIANIGPSIPYVIKILSMPVCGVEIKNERVAPLDAPLLYKEAATGITPHEHRGIGTPKIDAFIIDNAPGLPKLFIIVSFDIII